MEISESNALALVLKAFESKSITLGGPNSAETPEAAGKRDAEYINALLQALATKPRPR